MLQEIIELQNKAVKELVETLPAKDIITFKAPTGAGKTFMMASFMDRVLAQNDNVVFLVSSLSKAKLAQQNYDKFQSYYENGFVRTITPYLISEAVDSKKSEAGIHIPLTENVYILPTDLYKDNSRLKQQSALLHFFKEITKNKEIYLIKDEAHRATNNLDELRTYFSKVIDISATPKSKPDVEITEADAVQANLIKTVQYKSSNEYKNEEFTVGCMQYNELKTALDWLKEEQKHYSKFNIKPCMIIQISNTEQGSDQVQVIKHLLSENDYKDLHWISVFGDSKGLVTAKCETNDQLIKNKPDKWEKYVVSNTSTIDVVIFKMKLTEGWDMPRANILFQIRDSKSKTLDCQLIGRVRRNPKLLDFETVTDLNDQKHLMTAYVWGVREKDKQSSTVDVRLKGKVPDQVLNISNEIQNELKLNVTKLIDNILTEKSKFDIKQFLETQEKQLAKKSIFDLYDDLRSSTQKVQTECFDFIKEQNDPYTAYFGFVNNINEIKTKISDILKDYKNSIEIVKNSLNKNLEVSLPFNSFYIKNSQYSMSVNGSVWTNGDSVSNFDFDSNAERLWLNKLLTDGFNIKKIPLSDASEVYLVGKNYLPNSDIKYEYYNNGGRHYSYPDFVLKNKNDEYFLFEVKSVNTSSAMNIDSAEYIQKVEALKEFYCAVSSKVNHYFCLPIQKGSTWTVYVCYQGVLRKFDYDEIKDLVNGIKVF